uniref:Glutathione peroxidase 5 n=1 Tax=Botryllus schlosseri TaxID=30301 RepID=A0A1C8FSS8_BOTSH|nr:glutathione peroxidase 5 [Botryllus schlosseri]
MLWALLVASAALVAADDASQCLSQGLTGTVYDSTEATLAGTNVDLTQLFGYVSVVMNPGVYSEWTSQMMTGMNTLLEKYESDGVVGLGFPCNQFNLEQPGSPGEILNAYKYLRPGNGWTPHQNFHLFTVTEVNGDTASDIFKFLRSACPAYTEELGSKASFYWDTLVARDLRGTYEKFVIDKNGKPRYRFAPNVAMTEIYPYIDELLAETPIQPTQFPGVEAGN